MGQKCMDSESDIYADGRRGSDPDRIQELAIRYGSAK